MKVGFDGPSVREIRGAHGHFQPAQQRQAGAGALAQSGSVDSGTLGVPLMSCVTLAGHTALLPLSLHLSRTQTVVSTFYMTIKQSIEAQ